MDLSIVKRRETARQKMIQNDEEGFAEHAKGRLVIFPTAVTGL
jgi:hypothetical protein